METRSSLDDFRPEWKKRFSLLNNFGFSEEESEFTLGWEGGPEKSRIEIRFSPKAYRAINRAAQSDKEKLDDFLSIEPTIVRKNTVLHLSHYQLATLHYIILFLFIPKLKSEKHQRITKNKKEISKLVQCMLEDGPKVRVKKPFYRKRRYYILYSVGRNEYEVKGTDVKKTIQQFDERLKKLRAI